MPAPAMIIDGLKGVAEPMAVGQILAGLVLEVWKMKINNGENAWEPQGDNGEQQEKWQTSDEKDNSKA